MRSRHVIGMAVLWGLTTAVSAQAQDKAAAPMTVEQQAMMQKMLQYGTAGANHQVFQQVSGRWTHTIRSWMKPGDKVQVSTGTSENTPVFGGRFLKQEAHGNWNGQPFEGLGYTGYDNVGGVYQSVWFDNMGTGMMVGSGAPDPANPKLIKQTGTFSCPITGEKAMWYRSEWKITDSNNQTYTMYGKGPDGKEFKNMEIVYKRAK